MTKKPLVIGSQGQIQQLQAGDVTPSVDQFDATNGDAAPHLPGMAVYISASDTVKAAIATSYAEATVAAFATGTVAASAIGSYQAGGRLDIFTGLTPGNVYFLSPTVAGGITSTPPTTVGQWISRVGQAFSATALDVEIEAGIEL